MKIAIRELFSEPGANGTLSWGRVASAVALLGALVWVSKIVFQTHTLPAFDGITAFVLAPYGANKVATAAQAFAQK
jgi:hypothetical protein